MERMTTTLIVLAATMGNRYGGLKKLESIGPNGETVLDYSIYDAVRVGFNKIVFVISRFFEEEFKVHIASRYESLVEISFVYQEVDLVPVEKRNPKRSLLWGSAQALLVGEGVVNDCFAVINAVNFYQRESFDLLYNKLRQLDATRPEYVMISYRLANVIPESGSANRGICEVDENGLLLSVTDRPGVERISGHPMYLDELNKWVQLPEDAYVSMNMWGFTPAVYRNIRKDFDAFIEQNGQDLKASFTIPDFINGMIKQGEGIVRTYETSAIWMGVVSPDDKIQTILKINELIRKGVYPMKLFENDDEIRN